MNPVILKQTAILSAILGGILGLLTLIPFVGGFSFLILMLCISAIIIIYMKRNELIGIIDLKEGAILGAVIGFVSFIAFSIVFIPLAAILSLIFKMYYYLGWLTMLLKASGLFVLVILVIFMGILSALMNAFTGLSTAYAYEVLSGIKKEQNESVDFEIKE
ncbi:MAG: hypothetical protein PHC64_06220 [Candidatus Gastranaerophilales bacterium]|nr:hypothetical protein [Candidatus Gastranaerophilales bacterium]